MSAALWLNNLGAYWVQMAILVVAGTAFAAAARLRSPRAAHAYWQALLVACLILPWVQPWQQLATAQVEILGITQAPFNPAQTVSRFAWMPSARIVLTILAAGILLRFLWLAIAFVKLRRALAQARRLEPLPESIRGLQSRLGVAATMLIVPKLSSPATFGLRRPRILLPAHFAQLNAPQQEAIVAHELLHAARRDWAFSLAEEITLALFWFHPVVWWVVNRIRLSREQVVDREVVSLVGARRPYLDALLEIAAQAGTPVLAAAPFLNESQLAERIRLLVKEDVMSKRRLVLTICGVAVLTLAAGFAGIRAFPLSAPGAAPEETKTAGKPPLKILKKTQPVYPASAKAAGIEGQVVLECTVAKDGHVADVKVLRGEPNLAESATQAVKEWQFAPLDKPSATTKIEINYTLADKPATGSTVSRDVKGEVGEGVQGGVKGGVNGGVKGGVTKSDDSAVGKGVVKPVPIEKTNPKYTPEAKAAKVQGTVKLSVVIEADGTVGDVNVVQSLEKSLDQAAVDAVKTWKFKPGMKDGEPVPVKTDIEINFKLY